MNWLQVAAHALNIREVGIFSHQIGCRKDDFHGYLPCDPFYSYSNPCVKHDSPIFSCCYLFHDGINHYSLLDIPYVKTPAHTDSFDDDDDNWEQITDIPHLPHFPHPPTSPSQTPLYVEWPPLPARRITLRPPAVQSPAGPLNISW